MSDFGVDAVTVGFGSFELLVPQDRVRVSSRTLNGPSLGQSIHFIELGVTLTILQCSIGMDLLAQHGFSHEELEGVSILLQEPFGQALAKETLDNVLAEFELTLDESGSSPNLTLAGIFVGFHMTPLSSQRAGQVAALAQLGDDQFLIALSNLPEHRSKVETELPHLIKLVVRAN